MNKSISASITLTLPLQDQSGNQETKIEMPVLVAPHAFSWIHGFQIQTCTDLSVEIEQHQCRWRLTFRQCICRSRAIE
jgi:hypothetical protein